MLVAAGHVRLGLAALPPASQLETKGWALLLWELWRGTVGQGTHQGGGDNSHPWPGEQFFIFIAAFPEQWNDFLGEAQPGARFFRLNSKLGSSHRLSVTASPFSRAPSALHTQAATPDLAAALEGLQEKFPFALPSHLPIRMETDARHEGHVLHFHRDGNTQRD